MNAYKYVCNDCGYVVLSFGDDDSNRMACLVCPGWAEKHEAKPITKKWWEFWK